jgi:predicted DNA-binding protein
MNKKNFRISFRAEEDLYKFLADISKKLGTDLSTAVRKIVEWYIMSVMLGEFKANGLEKRFMNKYKVKKAKK